MFEIDPMSRTPIYRQLVERVETLILRGILGAGDMLPSTRQLSCTISVNPNTIQKAYSELLTRGIIASSPGRGCFVTENAQSLLTQERRAGLAELEAMVKTLAIAGISRDTLISVIDGIYEPEKEETK